jgi:NitT/TauT family transport system permease protein
VAFAALLVLTIMSIVLYYAIELIEKLAVPWATGE